MRVVTFSILSLLPLASALLGGAPVVTCRLHATRSGLVTANTAPPRRAVLAAAACLLIPSRAWAGYALQAANQQQHNWQATDKSKEQAVYQQIKNSIDAKRPDRPDADYCENPAPALRPKRCAQWYLTDNTYWRRWL